MAPPPPPLHHPISELNRRHTGRGRLRKRDNLLMGEGGGDGGGDKSYKGKKAWSFLNNSIFTGCLDQLCVVFEFWSDHNTRKCSDLSSCKRSKALHSALYFYFMNSQASMLTRSMDSFPFLICWSAAPPPGT